MGLFKPRSVLQRTKADALQDHMRGIKQLVGDDNAKLTLVIRTERLEKPMVITNDSQAEAIKAMREMMPGKNLIVQP